MYRAYNKYLSFIIATLYLIVAHHQFLQPTTATNVYTFNESLTGDNRNGVYNYCPSSFIDDEEGIFYCSNETPYIVQDSIYYTDSEHAPVKVLSPTKESWDSVHVCDPTVIAGDWSYNGETYKYLMAYLGCSTTDNQNNQIGLAVSNAKDHGWIKVSNQPFISYTYDNRHTDAFQWGVGQPSLLNIGNGFAAVFYTEGTWNLTSTKCAVYDLSNLNNPVYIDCTTVNNAGLTQIDDNSPDFMSNADFALSGTTMYVVCDTHPFGLGLLDCIPTVSKIYKTDIDIANLLGSLKTCMWDEVCRIDNASKNHNCCLSRTPEGLLAETSALYTSANEKSSYAASLWSYSIQKYDFY